MSQKKKNIVDKMKKTLLSISHQEQKKRELEKFVNKKDQLLNMSCDEIDLIYFKYKAKLEHKKLILPLFLVSIFVAIITDWFKCFYDFIETILKYSENQLLLGCNEMEKIQVLIVVFTVLTIFIIVIILICIITYIKKIYLLSKETLLIEDVRNKKKGVYTDKLL